MRATPREPGGRTLRVAINAQLFPDGRAGGVQQAVLGLVYALGRLDGDDIEYVIATRPETPNWLEPYLGRNQRVVAYKVPDVEPRAVKNDSRLPRLVHSGFSRTWRLARRLLSTARRETPRAAISDGFFESLGVDVIHFPYQSMVVSAVPSIFNPWDLQHLHYPEFFPATMFAKREANYPLYCRHAHAVVVASQWARRDIVDRYKLDPAKVYVIPLAASTQLNRTTEDPALVWRKYRLPERFAFYPAQTWPHKNHIRLLEAIALLRDQQGLQVELVCTGVLNDFWPTISARIDELRLWDQVRFLGFVPQSDLRTLYRLAEFVIIPSLFEGWGFPLIEAFEEGVPVASSETTSLTEYAGDAALLFDPTSVESIAGALLRMATEPELREALVRRGRERARTFSWERAATAYRALYRKVAGEVLSGEDEQLLSCPTSP